MHEYSLVQSLLERVLEQARAHDATAVHSVTVRIGPAAGVEPDLFATAFEHCRQRSRVSAEAELIILSENERWSCPMCQSEIGRGHQLSCPSCDWPLRLTAGDALSLERMELEVPNHV